jgi:hypothetical protein
MIKNIHFRRIVRLTLPIVVCFLLSVPGSGQNSKQDLSGMRKYNSLMQMIKFAYVDSVNESKLVEKAIVETLKELDPHSMYISKKDLQRANEELVGNFEGIGVQFEILKDTINIVHPIPGGPSERLGIRSLKSKARMLQERKSLTSLYSTVCAEKKEPGSTYPFAVPGKKTSSTTQLSAIKFPSTASTLHT